MKMQQRGPNKPKPMEQAFGAVDLPVTAQNDATDAATRLALSDLEAREKARDQFRASMTPSQRDRVFNAVLEQAAAGHVQAAALLMAYDMGKPTQPEEKRDLTPVSGAAMRKTLESAVEAAKQSGVDTSLLDAGIWGPQASSGR
jgi:hypothetical protein